jgi:hypothetical protein
LELGRTPVGAPFDVLTGGDGSLFGKHRRAPVMGRVAKLEQQARTRARARRIALDYDRAARDRRVEAAAAEAILALEVRGDAERDVRAAEVLVGDALHRILAEGVKVGSAAQLCHLSVGEVQRFRQAANMAPYSSGHVGPAGPNPVGLPDGTLPALDDVQVQRRRSEESRRSQQQPVDVARVR